MSEIYERVEQLADYYKVSKPSEFAKITGFSHQVATNYLKGKRNPTTEALTTIIKAFPGLNSDWLLSGLGSMLKTEEKKESPEVDVESRLSEIDFLKREIQTIRELLKEKDRLIEKLEYVISDRHEQN